MLTAEQIAQFHRDGFLRIRGVFAREEINALRAACDVVEHNGRQRFGRQGVDYLLMADEDGQPTYWRSERCWDRGGVFGAVTVHPRLLACIGQCLGHAFVPVNDSFVCKTPGNGAPVAWHQDPPYDRPRDTHVETFGVPNFDVDIYLDRSTVDNGCVHGIPGHHLVGHVPAVREFGARCFDHPLCVPMEMEAGDVLFHSLSAPHGSRGNRTETYRRIFYVHYMAREVLEHCYKDWGRPWHDLLARVADFRAARRSFGWDDVADGGPLAIEDDGIRYTGATGTPPWHWRDLAAAIDPEEKGAKRRLAAAVAKR